MFQWVGDRPEQLFRPALPYLLSPSSPSLPTSPRGIPALPGYSPPSTQIHRLSITPAFPSGLRLRLPEPPPGKSIRHR